MFIICYIIIIGLKLTSAKVRFSFEIHKRITKKMMGGKKGKRGKGENKGLDSFSIL